MRQPASLPPFFAVRFSSLAVACAATLLAGCSSKPVVAPEQVKAPTAPSAAVSENDYSNGDNWLCLHGRIDACSVNLDASVFRRGGEPAGHEGYQPASNPPVDCFYVYPTISNDPTPNSDMNPGPEEKRAVEHQFARFGSVCRLFAPVYRQVTIQGLRSRLTGQPMAVNPQVAYGDVLAAWRYYLQHHNQGRGIVLVGHSQGARILSELLRQEVEGKPVQKQLVSALLIGTNISVPPGKDVGGTFSQLPLCRSASQAGCVITYVSFRDRLPPPANSLFGRVGDGSQVACTNPAALGGGRGVLRSYLPVQTNLTGQAHDKTAFAAMAKRADAPFASPEGIASAECVQRDNASYLSVSIDPAYTAKGIDIAGDLYYGDRLLQEWGLHLVDVDLAQGNLIDIVRQQSKAWTTANR
ncbi:DUF3089 domain-containing protein [Noviherbaspirillum galbum]|uniref:DUF3089 domain-containing protein n=1 Tax=Noviherbaspirillum galbum TaxID=2709383 RepID=A0A6B3SUC9_9BURK|nr:DUF3089 domain-containing protein [Noviherbaspirillum galbum]NEX64191.1 DUF3089 domain-containing protein [Noviherbaspirillum galbum]